ncbi:MAG: sigma-70 family RNA polymerase sigma factor [Anaerolineales bacterium]|nr:sigma-70 family RNA polymerase sigma factor [Anaerolineales bacterium]
MDELTDQDLIRRTRRGDLPAFGVIVQRYQGSVFNVCYRFMSERQVAEDMTQDAFLRAHQRLDSYDDGRPFGPWIRRVAANLCINELNRNRQLVFSLNEQMDTPNDPIERGPEQAQVVREQRRRVQEAIIELPPHYRAVIELRHFQELSYKEIARTLSIPLSDVKSHLYRARQTLAERLAPNV